MTIIAETWQVDQRVQLKVQRLGGRHRLTGALTRGAPARGSALLFCGCRSLHGCFMRRPLDAVFVDAAGVVVRVARLAPWRLVVCRAAVHAFELAAGEAARLQIGIGARLEKFSP